MIIVIKYFYLIVIIFLLQGCSDNFKKTQFQLVPSLDDGTNYTCNLSEELLVMNNFDTLVNSADSSMYYLVYEKQIDTTFNYVFKIIYLDTNMFKYNILESI